MDAEVARLFVSVDARLNGLQEGLRTGERQAKTSGQQIEGSLKGVAAQSERTGGVVKRHARETVAENIALTGSFSSMARQAVLAGGAVAAVYVGFNKAREAITSTSELAHQTLILHRNTGLAVETSSELEAVLKARGIDANSAAMGFQTLARQVIAAETGSKKAQAGFLALGITAKDLKAANGDLNILLPRIAEGFGNIKGGADRAALSQALLGRGYRSLLPLFAQGAKGLNDQLDAAKRYGAVLSGDTLAKQEQLIKAQRALSLSSIGLKLAFTQAITPALVSASHAAAQFAAILHGPGSVDQKLSQIGKVVAPAFKTIETELEKEIPKIASAAGRDAPKVADAFIQGFEHADSWGKLALGAFLISKTVGWGTVFKAAGSRAATAFSSALALTGTAEDAAAGAAGGTAYGEAFSAAAARVPIFGPGGQILKEVEVGGPALAAAGAPAGEALGVSLAASAGAALAAGIIAWPVSKWIEGQLPHWLSGLNPFSGQVDPIGQLANLITGGPSKPSPDSTAKQQAQQVFQTLGGGRRRYVDVARRAAITAGVDPNVFINQINRESGFNPFARSNKGALGIAQLMPDTARHLHVNPNDPDASLQAAAKLMATYLAQFNNNIAKALVAYNAGPGDANLPFKQLPKETQGYLTAILGKGAPGMLTHGANTPSFTDLLNGLNKKKGQHKAALIPGDLAWAQRMLGHFKETTGQNTGPELDQLQREFGTHAAAWCAEFVTTALVKAGFPKSIKTPSVAQLNKWAGTGAHGLSFTTDPKPGDVITLGNHHTAIVESVDRHKGVVHVISGNSDTSGPGSQGVMRRTYAIGSGRYISVNAAGGSDPGSVTHSPKPTVYDRLQKTLATLQLEVQAGILSARDGAEAERRAIEQALPHLRGDNKLQALVTLKGLPKFKPNTWTGRNKRALALAYLNLNPHTANPAILKAAGIDTTLSNPWLSAYSQGIDNNVGSGAMTQDAGNRAKLKVLRDALPFLSGQVLADAKTQVKQLTDAIEANTQTIKDGGLQIGSSIVSLLSQPGGKALLDSLVAGGVDQIPGLPGLSVSALDNSPDPSQTLAAYYKNTVLPGDLAAYMSATDPATKQDDLAKLVADSQTMIQLTAQIADNSQAEIDLLKQERDQALRAEATASTTASAALSWIHTELNKKSGTTLAGRALMPSNGSARRP